MKRLRHHNDPERYRVMPLEPFRAWLVERVAENGSVAVTALQLGVKDRQLRTWLERQYVSVRLDLADLVACSYGDPMLLREWWPDLYRFDEERAAA